MKQSELIERVAKKGKMTKVEARRMVDLVMGQLENGVKEVRNNGRVRSHGSAPSELLSVRDAWGAIRGPVNP